ncbi:type IV pilin N-terminal domain-containing protein [Methanoculleus sp. UBA374]|jgi:FlaG/FlaF family flagellin (archaellin)|uniref:type IV pilin N-terminal domain-containing protein n=2 Tax=Methanoculleus TaxID=45989 RepID=UPI00319E3ED8
MHTHAYLQGFSYPGEYRGDLMKNGTTIKRRDDAVSPVIGVMLMLVVTIIIAAVVSGFAGGLVTSQEPAPSASFDVSLTDDSIDLTVRSISEEVSSKDIAIVLSKTGQMRKLVPGTSTVPFGFNIVERPVKGEDGTINGTGFHDNENVTIASNNSKISGNYAANASNSIQWFGNYTLKTGSRMSASTHAFVDVLGVPLPAGFSKLSYTKSEFLDLTDDQWKEVFGETVTAGGGDKNNTAVLSIKSGQKITDKSLGEFLAGKGFATEKNGVYEAAQQFWVEATDTKWKFGQTIVYNSDGDGNGGITVSPGDRVTVTIVHTPSGQSMFTKTVTVKEA